MNYRRRSLCGPCRRGTCQNLKNGFSHLAHQWVVWVLCLFFFSSQNMLFWNRYGSEAMTSMKWYGSYGLCLAPAKGGCRFLKWSLKGRPSRWNTVKGCPNERIRTEIGRRSRPLDKETPGPDTFVEHKTWFCSTLFSLFENPAFKSDSTDILIAHSSLLRAANAMQPTWSASNR